MVHPDFPQVNPFISNDVMEIDPIYNQLLADTALSSLETTMRGSRITEEARIGVAEAHVVLDYAAQWLITIMPGGIFRFDFRRVNAWNMVERGLSAASSNPQRLPDAGRILEVGLATTRSIVLSQSLTGISGDSQSLAKRFFQGWRNTATAQVEKSKYSH